MILNHECWMWEREQSGGVRSETFNESQWKWASGGESQRGGVVTERVWEGEMDQSISEMVQTRGLHQRWRITSTKSIQGGKWTNLVESKCKVERLKGLWNIQYENIREKEGYYLYSQGGRMRGERVITCLWGTRNEEGKKKKQTKEKDHLIKKKRKK